jgi:hypothetical protein
MCCVEDSSRRFVVVVTVIFHRREHPKVEVKGGNRLQLACIGLANDGPSLVEHLLEKPSRQIRHEFWDNFCFTRTSPSRQIENVFFHN